MMAGLASYKRRLQAGKSEVISARGSTIVLRHAVSEVSVRARQTMNQQSGESYVLTMRKGQKQFTASEFTQVEVVSDDAQDIEVLIGYGDYVEPPPDVASADYVTAFTPTNLIGLGNQMIRAEQPFGHRVIIKAAIANDEVELWIAGSEQELIDGKYFPLSAGESLTLETRGEIWGAASAEGACTYYILEEDYSAPTL